MPKEPTYAVELLLKSKEFRIYQPDFARVILTKSTYTKPEARKALDAFFEGGN